MGYLTKFELDIIEKDNKTDHVAEIGKISDYGEDWENEGIKWYDCNKDMLEYSLKHPETVFKLIGYGEEQGDIWCNYYKNGKYQETKGRIIFDDFNELKLR